MKNKTRNLIPVLVIVLYSILFFAVILSKNRSSLYVDDNILQWGPVINKALIIFSVVMAYHIGIFISIKA